MPRTPRAIATELRELNDTANKTFVPVNLSRAMDLTLEWVESVTATLDAAGLLPAEPQPEAPKA